jgi:hypothetical protein
VRSLACAGADNAINASALTRAVARADGLAFNRWFSKINPRVLKLRTLDGAKCGSVPRRYHSVQKDSAAKAGGQQSIGRPVRDGVPPFTNCGVALHPHRRVCRVIRDIRHGMVQAHDALVSAQAR